MFQPNISTVVTCAPDGVTDQRYLGTVGHVGALNYGYAIPGGCDQLTCNLMMRPLYRSSALYPGRIVKVIRGIRPIWEGKLNEPTPTSTGWSIQAYGNGHYGDDFMSYHTNYGVACDPVAKAIAGTPSPRGQLRWVAPASWPGGLYLQQPPDSASVSITQYMNDITGPANYLWYVGLPGNVLTVFQPPTAANRLLIVDAPLARTLAGYFTWLWLRYQSQAQQITGGSGGSGGGSGAAVFSLTSVSNQAQQNRHGVKETYGDLSSAGTLSNSAAENIGTSLMAKYQAANYAGPFTVLPGMLCNLGGSPVDLGCEQAGTVVRVMVATGGFGGDVVPPAPPIQFMTGAYSYSDETENATITPYLAVSNDLATLLSNYTTIHTPKTPQSTWATRYVP